MTHSAAECVMWPFYSQTIDWLAIIGEGERRGSHLHLGESSRWWDLLTWVENMTRESDGKPFGCRGNFFFPCRLEICNLLWMHNYDVWATWECVTLSVRCSHSFRHCWYWNTFMVSSRTVTNCQNSRKMQKVHAAWLISRVATFVRKTRRDEKMKYKIQKHRNTEIIMK